LRVWMPVRPGEACAEGRRVDAVSSQDSVQPVMDRWIVNLYQRTRPTGRLWRDPVRNLGEGRSWYRDREGGSGDTQVIPTSRDNARKALRSIGEWEAVVAGSHTPPKRGRGGPLTMGGRHRRGWHWPLPRLPEVPEGSAMGPKVATRRTHIERCRLEGT